MSFSSHDKLIVIAAEVGGEQRHELPWGDRFMFTNKLLSPQSWDEQVLQKTPNCAIMTSNIYHDAVFVSSHYIFQSVSFMVIRINSQNRVKQHTIIATNALTQNTYYAKSITKANTRYIRSDDSIMNLIPLRLHIQMPISTPCVPVRQNIN